MKTSKIIFISFFSFIGLLLLSFLIVGFAYNDAGIKNRKNRMAEVGKREKTIKIEKQFKHILVKNKGSITIFSGEEQSLKHSVYNEKDSLKAPKLEIKNDTLFLSLYPKMNNKLTLKDLDSLKSISCVNSNVSLANIEIPTLSLNFERGWIKLYNKTKIKNLNVRLSKNSGFDIYNDVILDTLNLDINNSKINSWNNKIKISLLKGIINNKSNVRIPRALHVNLAVDESSELHM